MSKTVKAVIAAVVVLVLGIGTYFLVSYLMKESKRLTTSEFEKYITDPRADILFGPAMPAEPETPNESEEPEEKEDPEEPEQSGVPSELDEADQPNDSNASDVPSGSVGEIDDKKQIVKVVFDGYSVYGYTSVTAKNYAYWTTQPSVYNYESFEAWVAKYGGILQDYDMKNPNAGSAWDTVVYVAILVVGVIAFFLILRATSGGGGKVMNFGKTKAKVTTNLKVRFSDVAGAEEEKEELKEVVEFLRSPKRFSDLGAKIPKGVLLVGPPGTGKTLFAKAVAGEAGVPFFSVSGSDFVEMYVGVGASRVRDLFDLAKRNQPCIIFIDEIDAVGRERGAGLGGGHDEREQTLNQILVQMDGFESNEGVIVMAATNRADILDKALLRPGRFDRQIYVHLPDVRGREMILKVHARNKPLAPEVNFKIIARMTSGFSGADLANLLNEAAILAAREGKQLIGNHEIYEGINKVLLGPQKKSRVVTEADKKCTAYHEAGHAILSKLCEKTENVHEVSIIPRGMAAGYTLTRPESDDNDYTVGKLNDMICMMLGGRVAEEIVIQDISAGASNDIKRVSQIARKMVTEWGMSEKLGPIAYASDGPVFLGRDFEERNTYSEETAAIIDEEVKAIVAKAYERARKLLTESRAILDNMARVLVERETIYTAEVDMLMKGESWETVLAYMEKHDNGAPDDPFGTKAGAQTESDSAQKTDSESDPWYKKE